jgi:hypothetical protein
VRSPAFAYFGHPFRAGARLDWSMRMRTRNRT